MANCFTGPNISLKQKHPLKRANKPNGSKSSLPIRENPKMSTGSGSLMWFRKGLRIHDNPALEHASKASNFLYPVFVIDPHYMKPDPTAPSPGSSRAGLNRIRFLLQSLVDLDLSLKKLGSRLLVLKGDPGEVIVRCLKEVIKTLIFYFSLIFFFNFRSLVEILGFRVLICCLVEQWDVKKLCFEYDTEPYYQALDGKVKVCNSTFFNFVTRNHIM